MILLLLACLPLDACMNSPPERRAKLGYAPTAVIGFPRRSASGFQQIPLNSCRLRWFNGSMVKYASIIERCLNLWEVDRDEEKATPLARRDSKKHTGMCVCAMV